MNSKKSKVKALQQCVFCKKKSSLTCAKCGEYYCSKEHQIEDWVVHKELCCDNKYYKLVKEASNEQPKPVARVHIPPGTKIFQSEPIAVGPNAEEPVCLGCLRPLIYDVMSYLCPVCMWPVCGIDCQNSEMHQLECEAFRNAGVQFNTDSLRVDNWRKNFLHMPGYWMLVLRVLLSGKSKHVLKYYCKETHSQRVIIQRKKYLSRGVALIRNTWKLQQFKPQDITQVFEMLLDACVPVNQLQDKFSLSEKRAGLAIHASDLILLESSCHPNLHFSVADMKNPTSISITAIRDIKVGEKLSVNRGGLLECYSSTFLRQQIRHNMLFAPCSCQRCSDPSELGLYLSSFRCKTCEGMTVPLRTSNILETDWICKVCKCVLKCDEYKKKHKSLLMELLRAEKQENVLIRLEKFINTHSGPGGTLHSNHTLVLRAKRRFSEATYNNSIETGAAYQFDSKVLSQFRKYAQDYKTFHSSLYPGCVSEDILLQIIECKDTIYKLNKGEINMDQLRGCAMNVCLDWGKRLMKPEAPSKCNCSQTFSHLFAELLQLNVRLVRTVFFG